MTDIVGNLTSSLSHQSNLASIIKLLSLGSICCIRVKHFATIFSFDGALYIHTICSYYIYFYILLYSNLGWTSLMLASSYEFSPTISNYQPSDLGIIKTLLEYGADVNAKNNEGW